VIWHNRPLPVAANGAVLVGFAADNSRPELFTGGQTVGQYFRISELTANQLKPDWPAPQPIRFANGTNVVGFLTHPTKTFPTANQPWRVYLLAQVDTPNHTDQTFFVHLVNTAGDKYAQVDIPALPAGEQRSGETMLAQLDFAIGDGLPATGPLFLRVGLYGAEGQAQTIDANNNPIGDYGLIQIRGQNQPVFVGQTFNLDNLATNSPLLQGPPLTLTATWQVTKPITTAFKLQWRLANGNQTFYEKQEPFRDLSTVAVGAFWAESHQLRLPTDLAPGRYTLELALLDSNNQPIWPKPVQQPVEIQERQRQFTVPTIAQKIDASYENQITLLGYDLNLDSKMLNLNLYWQPQQLIDHDYKYFVHVWQNGQVVAQVDSAPAQYQYLTSWWAVGEVVTESITLDLTALPTDEYTLTTGFYDPSTGNRLSVTLADGSQLTDQWVTLQNFQLP